MHKSMGRKFSSRPLRRKRRLHRGFFIECRDPFPRLDRVANYNGNKLRAGSLFFREAEQDGTVFGHGQGDLILCWIEVLMLPDIANGLPSR